MVLQALTICLTIEFLMAIFLFKGDILAPAISFNFVFLLSALDLLLMSNYWSVNLQMITFWVIVCGVFAFLVGALTGKRIPYIQIKYIHNRIIHINNIEYKENFKIPKQILNVLIIVYGFFIMYTMLYVIRLNGLSVELSEIFSLYTTTLRGGTELYLPTPLFIVRQILHLLGYAWSYIGVNNWIENRKFEIRYAILFCLTLVISIANAKRGDMIALIITMVIYMRLALKRSGSKKIPRRVYFMVAFLFLLIIFSFQTIATIMGRDSNLFEPVEYFSIYLGAPILNLDTSIRKGHFSHPVMMSETFHSLYSSLGENFGIQSFIYKTDRIFWASDNGKRVGNVATTFYDFYHDGGFVTVIIMSFIMGLIAQSIYKKLLKGKNKNEMFFTLFFSYVLWLIIRSFFANSFYEWFTLSTITTLLVWWLCSISLPRIRS